jgi:hypothetical protein
MPYAKKIQAEIASGALDEDPDMRIERLRPAPIPVNQTESLGISNNLGRLAALVRRVLA